ncbi:cytochrome c/FTR1 family iron permease [Sphingosinicella terrae]|uniref:cytochrome c/FTR1 family iron permease n=1 Tax=Sphingosinicella terrae TaxID=2172047 RepID=UPI000E0DA35F|nr:cytochrome c/FTR1 family iron permease [Sphingosinicella terrae]
MSDRLRGVGSLWLCLLLVAAMAFPSVARADDAAVQTTWRLLDYIAVDYRGAVENGQIISQLEYDEMLEFTATVVERLAALPQHQAQPDLIARARALQAAVTRRAPPPEVERDARALAGDLLAAYPVPLAPTAVPDLARGQAVYAEQCVACHGSDGSARVPAAAQMDPPPIDFTDRSRARDRSLFALYQVTSQGLEETAMQSFAHLPEADRWALAFHAGRFAYPPGLAVEGERIWRSEAGVRSEVPDLQALVSLTPAALSAKIGEDKATAVMAYLRANPSVLVESAGAGTLGLGRDLLARSLEAYRAGERQRAAEHALAAYLEGFEPVEALLGARDGNLVVEVEREMGALRAAISRGVPENEVAERIGRLQTLFEQAEAAVSPDAASATSTFLGAFAILLREGLEALLIVIAMITFLVRAERRDLLRWVHAGWIAALVAGVATWWIATHLITISGANRELTEGFGSVLAAIILLFVGIWMHDKAQAGAWQAYVKDKLDRALGRGSLWLLFGLSFIAVYREVFETIIFFAAIGAQGENGAMIGGIAVAAVLLAVIAWAMLRFGRRLPITKFFQYSSALIAVIAVVLAGKGFAALQEAGMIGVTPLDGLPRSPILGLYPTVETLAAQAVTILLLVLGFRRSRRPVPALAE